MVDELISLCEDTIIALLILASDNLISENELESHLEKKKEFLKEFKLNY